MLAAILGVGATVAVIASGRQQSVPEFLSSAWGRAGGERLSYVEADPGTITSVGLGPFRVDEPIRPLLRAGVAERESCAAGEPLVTRDGSYADVMAVHQEGVIRYVMITSGSQFTTRSGLRVGSPLRDVKRVVPYAERTRDANTGRDSYLDPDGEYALLFVMGHDNRTATIFVGAIESLRALAAGGPRPAPC